MSLRSFINFPTKDQKKCVRYATETVLHNCNILVRQEMDEMRSAQKEHDGICPNCRIRKIDNNNNIVDKFAYVRGSGSRNAISISTEAINHCNICGNEWKKFETKAISQTAVLKVCLKYLNDMIKNPKEEHNVDKIEALNIFYSCYAEALYDLYKKHRHAFDTIPSLSNLREYYDSVYDKKQRELKKL